MRCAITRLAGQELTLDSLDDRFVSRAPQDDLQALGLDVMAKLSTHSFEVRTARNRLDDAMDGARSLGAAAYPYYRVQGTQSDFLISDRVFVRFQNWVTEGQWDVFADRYEATIVRPSYDAEVLLQLPPSADPVKVVREMSSDNWVALAEHDLNHLVSPLGFQPPTDRDYPLQWHLHDDLQDPAFNPVVSTRCDDAWRLLDGFGSPEVIVGLTDGGFDLEIDDFRSPTQRFFGWGFFRGRFIRTNLNVRATLAELAESPEHGTAMASLIGASANGELAVGVAPGCSLLPVSFERAGRFLLVATSRVRTAFRFLAHRADVISNSWGTGHFALWGKMFTDEVALLAKTSGRRGKGVVFVWAAGNSNCPIAREFTADRDVPIDNGRPAGFFEGPTTARRFRNDMVDIPGVVHVGAVSSTGRRSHYSNYGEGLSLCAPSSNEHLYGCANIVGPSLPIKSSPTAATLQEPPGGTSASAAIVAGVAALVISANPSLTADEVVSILQQTATKNLDMTPYEKTGSVCDFGHDGFDVSPVAPFDSGAFRNIGHPDGTWSPWFGYGCVDAGKAVRMAMAWKSGGGQAAQPADNSSDPEPALAEALVAS